MAVIYNADILKQIQEIADIVRHEGTVDFMCTETCHKSQGHFFGLDVLYVNDQVCCIKACDIEVNIKPVKLANDNADEVLPTSSQSQIALHFECGTPKILAMWHQTVTSFSLSAQM